MVVSRSNSESTLHRPKSWVNPGNRVKVSSPSGSNAKSQGSQSQCNRVSLQFHILLRKRSSIIGRSLTNTRWWATKQLTKKRLAPATRESQHKVRPKLIRFWIGYPRVNVHSDNALMRVSIEAPLCFSSIKPLNRVFISNTVLLHRLNTSKSSFSCEYS